MGLAILTALVLVWARRGERVLLVFVVATLLPIAGLLVAFVIFGQDTQLLEKTRRRPDLVASNAFPSVGVRRSQGEALGPDL